MGSPKTQTDDYLAQLDAEAQTWCIADRAKRQEKAQRERIRHPRLIRDLLLDRLDTHLMDVADVGGGPLPLSDLLPCRNRVVIDPCAEEYAAYFPTPDHITCPIEDLAPGYDNGFDLVICTNALDHVADYEKAIERLSAICRPGGYVAVMCAENNALTNPHPCHVINLTADRIHQALDAEFETVWELTFARDGYRYGWVPFEGRCGQPAFALLMRKCVGYNEERTP